MQIKKLTFAAIACASTSAVAHGVGWHTAAICLEREVEQKSSHSGADRRL